MAHKEWYLKSQIPHDACEMVPVLSSMGIPLLTSILSRFICRDMARAGEGKEGESARTVLLLQVSADQSDSAGQHRQPE